MSSWVCPSLLLLTLAAIPASAGEPGQEALLTQETPDIEFTDAASDSRRGSFWFSPDAWSSWDLRVTSLGIVSFLPEGPLAGELLEPEQDEAPRGRVTRKLVAVPRAAGRHGHDEGARASVMRLIRPRLRVRLTPRMPVVAAPAPARHPPAVSAR